MRQLRGEALCPRCGSTNLTYKNVFDYFKCNDCNSTFITPSYSYGIKEEPKPPAPEPPRETRQFSPPEAVSPPAELKATSDLAQQLFGEKELARREQVAPKTIETERRRPSKMGWLIFLIVILVLVFIGLIAWVFFGEQIGALLGL